MKIEVIKKKDNNKIIVDNSGRFIVIPNLKDSVIAEIENTIEKLIKENK